MKKKSVLTLAGLSATTLAVGLTFTSVGGFNQLFAKAGIALGTYYHFSEVAPTETEQGIREYWTDCQGGIVFEAPAASIVEGTWTNAKKQYIFDNPDERILPSFTEVKAKLKLADGHNGLLPTDLEVFEDAYADYEKYSETTKNSFDNYLENNEHIKLGERKAFLDTVFEELTNPNDVEVKQRQNVEFDSEGNQHVTVVDRISVDNFTSEESSDLNTARPIFHNIADEVDSTIGDVYEIKRQEQFDGQKAEINKFLQIDVGELFSFPSDGNSIGFYMNGIFRNQKVSETTYQYFENTVTNTGYYSNSQYIDIYAIDWAGVQTLCPTDNFSALFTSDTPKIRFYASSLLSDFEHGWIFYSANVNDIPNNYLPVNGKIMLHLDDYFANNLYMSRFYSIKNFDLVAGNPYNNGNGSYMDSKHSGDEMIKFTRHYEQASLFATSRTYNDLDHNYSDAFFSPTFKVTQADINPVVRSFYFNSSASAETLAEFDDLYAYLYVSEETSINKTRYVARVNSSNIIANDDTTINLRSGWNKISFDKELLGNFLAEQYEEGHDANSSYVELNFSDLSLGATVTLSPIMSNSHPISTISNIEQIQKSDEISFTWTEFHYAALYREGFANRIAKKLTLSSSTTGSGWYNNRLAVQFAKTNTEYSHYYVDVFTSEACTLTGVRGVIKQRNGVSGNTSFDLLNGVLGTSLQLNVGWNTIELLAVVPDSGVSGAEEGFTYGMNFLQTTKTSNDCINFNFDALNKDQVICFSPLYTK